MYRIYISHPSRVWRNTSHYSLLHGINSLALSLSLQPPGHCAPPPPPPWLAGRRRRQRSPPTLLSLLPDLAPWPASLPFPAAAPLFLRGSRASPPPLLWAPLTPAGRIGRGRADARLRRSEDEEASPAARLVPHAAIAHPAGRGAPGQALSGPTAVRVRGHRRSADPGRDDCR